MTTADTTAATLAPVPPVPPVPPFRFHAGRLPLLLSIPHMGTHVPPDIAARLTPAARGVPDTDFHLDLLYDFAVGLGASVLMATHSRYVIDLNRPSDNTNLYPGQNTTGLCPVDDFDSQPLYLDGQAPDAAEIATRLDRYWRPYHAQLAAELDRLQAAHGTVLLWDAHSIRSVLPRFFEGTLPHLNLGTAGGVSCDAALQQELLAIGQASAYRTVLNGRFTGGHITRHYARPAEGRHTVQLEMTQCCYMEETPPWRWRPDLADQVRPTLQRMFDAVLAFTRRAQG